MKVNQTLLQACIDNDRRSQSELYQLSFSAMMTIAYRYRIKREDASSLVNQCFLKIIRGLPSFINSNGSKSYFSWIQKIMMNTIIDEIRKNKKIKDIIYSTENSIYLESLSDGDYNVVEETIEAEALQVMLNKLSERQRSVFNLFAIDGLSHKEIAKAINISVTNSKWHLSQARKQLQNILKEQLEKQKVIQNG